MRNGIYRVWVNGPTARNSGVIVLQDGELIACNPTFGFVGSYTLERGRFSADVLCRRLSTRIPPINLPDRDSFQLRLEGPARSEFAALTGTIAEVPGFALPFEFAWLCEA